MKNKILGFFVAGGVAAICFSVLAAVFTDLTYMQIIAGASGCGLATGICAFIKG